MLLGAAGIGVSVFKIGALALIGDVSRSTREHTTFMNTVEGFFAVGAIVGPAIVATLLAAGLSWKYLYVIAALICVVLVAAAAKARYPSTVLADEWRRFVRCTRCGKMRDAHALGFSTLIMLYVAVEVAVYVWMPTYLQGYTGSAPWLATYALTIFFVLRAAGRFLGAWFLRKLSWSTVLAAFGAAILGCFAGSLYGGPDHAVYLLPLSGLFMSVALSDAELEGHQLFPALRAWRRRGRDLVLYGFRRCGGAARDGRRQRRSRRHQVRVRARDGLRRLLFVGLLINRVFDPAGARLASRDDSDYAAAH